GYLRIEREDVLGPLRLHVVEERHELADIDALNDSLDENLRKEQVVLEQLERLRFVGVSYASCRLVGQEPCDACTPKPVLYEAWFVVSVDDRDAGRQAVESLDAVSHGHDRIEPIWNRVRDDLASIVRDVDLRSIGIDPGHDPVLLGERQAKEDMEPTL